VWIDKNDLDLLKLTENTALSHSGLSADFELGFEQKENDLVCFQQRSPTPYVADPAEALEKNQSPYEKSRLGDGQNCFTLQKILYVLLPAEGTVRKAAANAVDISSDVFSRFRYEILARVL
jgi:hypothetical protein